MKIGILSDAHGNIHGLKKCVNILEKQGATKLYFLGDAVNYFSRFREVLNFLKQKDIKCIMGNHEELLLKDKEVSTKQKEVYNLEFTKKNLTEKDCGYIRSWRETINLEIDNLKILMVHGSPFNHLEEYIYPDSNLDKFAELNHDIILMGHTHIPFIKKVNEKQIVNVGSVGFQRDDGRFISCALFDTKQKNVKIIKEGFPYWCINELKPFHNDLIDVLKRRREGKNE